MCTVSPQAQSETRIPTKTLGGFKPPKENKGRAGLKRGGRTHKVYNVPVGGTDQACLV